MKRRDFLKGAALAAAGDVRAVKPAGLRAKLRAAGAYLPDEA